MRICSYAIPLAQFDNQFVTRVDFTINSRNNLYGRYFIDGFQQPPYFFPTNILVTTQSGNIERVQTFTLGEAYTITPNIVNAAHATIMRRRDNRGYSTSDINANKLGVSMYQVVPNGLQMTEGKFTIGGGTNSVSHFNDNTLAFDDDVTMVRGKHQIIFGGEWVQNQLNIGNAYEGNGVFTFNSEYSGNGPDGGTNMGDQSLDFLQGTLSAFQQSKESRIAARADSQPVWPGYLPRQQATDPGGRPALGAKFHAHGCLQPRLCLQHEPTSWPTLRAPCIPMPRPVFCSTAIQGFPRLSPRTHRGSSLRTSGYR